MGQSDALALLKEPELKPRFQPCTPRKGRCFHFAVHPYKQLVLRTHMEVQYMSEWTYRKGMNSCEFRKRSLADHAALSKLRDS